MKTYAEACAAKPFDWRLALMADAPEWDRLLDRAICWVTCACGNQCDVIPRFEDGAPVDMKLRALGVYFMQEIAAKHSLRALEILSKIEARSAEIIAEIESIKPGDGWDILEKGTPLLPGDGFYINGQWIDYKCRPDIFRGGGSPDSWYCVPQNDTAHTYPWRRKKVIKSIAPANL